MNILYIKFDFGFIRQFIFTFNSFWWSNSSENKMIDLQFYWQSTVQNYIVPILMLIIVIVFQIWKKRVQCLAIIYEQIKLKLWIKSRFKNIHQNFKNEAKHIIEWSWIYLFSRFMIISIIVDMFNFIENKILSTISLVIFLIFIFYSIKTKFKIFYPSYIKEMRPEFNYIPNFPYSL